LSSETMKAARRIAELVWWWVSGCWKTRWS